MSHQVIILFSRNNIKCFFSQNGSEFRTFKYQNKDIIPLYFLSDNTIFEFGHIAKKKYNEKDKSCFKDYFEIIKDFDATYNFLGDSNQPIKNLIKNAIETLIIEFYKTVLYTSADLNKIKTKLDLNFIYHSDINENECDFVTNLFINAGYKKINSFNYDYLQINALDKYDSNFKKNNRGYICADKSENDLILTYFEDLDSKRYKSREIGKNLATRIEVEIVAELLVDGTIAETGSLVNRDSEVKRLMPEAEIAFNEVDKKNSIFYNVELSDTSKASIRLVYSRINNITQRRSANDQDIVFLRTFIKETSIEQSELGILLNKNIVNQNFTEKVKASFSNDYKVNIDISETLQLFNEHPEVIENGILISAIGTSEEAEHKVLEEKEPESKKPQSKEKSGPPPIPKSKKSGPPPLTKSKKSSPPPLTKSKKSGPPPLPKKKSGPPPLPKSKKSGPPPLTKKKSGPPPLPKR